MDGVNPMPDPFEDPLATLKQIRRKDPRFALEAYPFIFQALEYTVKKAGEHRHVTGGELLDGIRHFAYDQFGSLAEMVFRNWGIKQSQDFGEIVFNLVEAEFMSKTSEDSRADFRNQFDLSQTLMEGYRIQLDEAR